MSILLAFDRDKSVMSLSDLSRRSGLPVATTHRLVAKLVESGALERQSEGSYCIGLQLWQTAALAPCSLLQQAAKAELLKLVIHTRTAVTLFVPDESDVVCLETLSWPGFPAGVQPGVRSPMHDSAAGVALLAAAEAKSLTSLPQQPDIDGDELACAVAHARRTGYVLREGSSGQGTVDVATVVRDREDEPLAAICVVSESRKHVTSVLSGMFAASYRLSRACF